MNWLSKIFQRTVDKAAPASPAFQEYWSEISGVPRKFTRATYRDLAQEGYMRNSAVYAAIDELATTASGIKWIVARDKTEGDVVLTVPDHDHPLNDILRRPNPEQSWQMFMKKVVATWLLGAELFLHRTAPNLEIRSLRPDQMNPLKNMLGQIVMWEQTFDNGTKRRYPVDVILHIKDFHPLSDSNGMSRLQAASFEIDIVNEGMKWNASLLRNGARPSGVLETDNNLDEDQYRRLREERRQFDQGSDNARGIMITEGGLHYKQLSLNPADLDFHNGMQTLRRNIWSVLNTPPELVGDSEAKTYSNYKEARQALYKENVLPLLDLLAAELNLWLSLDEDVSLAYSTDDVEALQPDQDKLHERVRKDVEAGIITTNEGREELGYAKSKEPEAERLRIIPGGTAGGEEMESTGDTAANSGSANGNN